MKYDEIDMSQNNKSTDCTEPVADYVATWMHKVGDCLKKAENWISDH